jgi:hypothetical protein
MAEALAFDMGNSNTIYRNPKYIKKYLNPYYDQKLNVDVDLFKR